MPYSGQFCDCELGKEKQRHWQKSEREAREAGATAKTQAREHGICDSCFAKDPERSRCYACNTTGQHFTDQELSTICPDCKGLRKLKSLGDKDCFLCKGTGQPKLRRVAS
jgi:DnaJ-class molecular chaperone